MPKLGTRHDKDMGNRLSDALNREYGDELKRQRTARYAYSAAGDRQAAQLEKYSQQWEKLEGREPQRQQKQAKAKKIERDNSPGMSRQGFK